MDGAVEPLEWHKSTYSGTSGCVELASGLESIYIRDSKDSCGPALTFPKEQWQTFLGQVKSMSFSDGEKAAS